MRVLACAIAVLLGNGSMAGDAQTNLGQRLNPDAAEWKQLEEEFARQPDTIAAFEERRFFSFRKEPVVLSGAVRVSRARGLSLHYLDPEQRTIVIDDRGMLLRDAAGQDSPPPDPRAGAANEALRQVLRFDFAALEKDFEVYGRHDGAKWTVALVPRTRATRRLIGEIFVSGEGAAVQRIELRRTAKQRIEITMTGVRAVEFTPEDIRRYFRR